MVARKAAAGGPEPEAWGPYGGRAKSKPISKQTKKRPPRPPLAVRPPATDTPDAPMEPTLPGRMLLRSHDPPKRIHPSPRNLLPEFEREATKDNNEGSDSSDGGDDDPPNSDGRDRPPNRPLQEDQDEVAQPGPKQREESPKLQPLIRKPKRRKLTNKLIS